ncbi:long-chain-fatty-acyl-CoA reductase domain protein [Capnocytophaga sp. oral taxon 412 str. F0487]|uniref:acyl-CoA reductase n=1 Tax=Capnocytophaga sp. oral taxon 412 TaxID=712218 RepID=UPI000269701C|nr:acyl-CoA reductase [Capnocytophaga sp. oral taxon 412]EIW93423.1 long-chain-fatty-acyl-CoA reductase domain protein [Capnocytophaga sp. oral taxon 412 str. F0487]
MKQQNINNLVRLGELLSKTEQSNDIFDKAEQQNSWFTRANVTFAFKSWSEALSKSNVQQWLSQYQLPQTTSPKKILIIMAGNLPLVGFHDLLCVLVAGHKAIVKLSSDDRVLLPYLITQIRTFAPEWAEAVAFTDDKVTEYDAVIATGSDNTARYFEYYFGKKPHIIRKNRHSVAVLTGEETPEELQDLGKDIFLYYGLGCRSVSKLFVPQGYDFDLLFQAIYPYKDIIEEQKYANNYDYNKAVYLMSLYKLLENGFLLLKEDEHYGSPIATLFYEYYTNKETLKKKLATDREKIQCVVGHNFIDGEIPFGQTQTPKLWDYADGVNTLTFLLNL